MEYYNPRFSNAQTFFKILIWERASMREPVQVGVKGRKRGREGSSSTLPVAHGAPPRRAPSQDPEEKSRVRRLTDWHTQVPQMLRLFNEQEASHFWSSNMLHHQIRHVSYKSGKRSSMITIKLNGNKLIIHQQGTVKSIKLIRGKISWSYLKLMSIRNFNDILKH